MTINTICDIFLSVFIKRLIFQLYLPNGVKQYCLLYLAGGIFIPILIKKLCDLAIKPIKKKINAMKQKNQKSVI